MQVCLEKSRTRGTEWRGGIHDIVIIKVCFVGKFNPGGEIQKAKSKQRECHSLMYVGGTRMTKLLRGYG